MGESGSRSHAVAPASLAPIDRGIARVLEAAPERLPVLSVPLEDVHRFMRQDVAAVLHEREAEPGDIQEPPTEVLVPAIEALRYASQRQAFACLVASSMDRRIADSVLPAYVEVLKQLSSDELSLLQAVPAPGRVFPVSNLMFKLVSRELLVAYRHILPGNLARTCRIKSNIPQYVDNLLRLSLIARDPNATADAAAYRGLTRFEFVRAMTDRAPPNANVMMDNHVLSITSFGQHFRRACILG